MIERLCPHCCKPISEHVTALVGLRRPDTPAPPQPDVLSGIVIPVSARTLARLKAEPGAFARWAEEMLVERGRQLALVMIEQLEGP